MEKQGNKRECQTYRGSSLLSHACKLFEKTIEQSMRCNVDPLLSSSQFGFRRGSGSTDVPFTIRQLIERTIEYDKGLNISFVDQGKAFATVDKNILFETLEKLRLQRAIIRQYNKIIQTI